MEKTIMTALPLAFLVHLQISGAVLARRSICLDGRPPIARRLFYTSKHLIILVWLVAALSSWGAGFALLAGTPVLHGLTIGIWILGFTVLSR